MNPDILERLAAEKNGSIQEALNWGAELATEIQKDLDDGVLSFWEGVALTDNSLQLIGLVRNYKKIPDDWEYLRKNEAYKDAIIKGIESKLGVASEKAKEIVLQGIVTGIELSKFIHLCTDAKNKAA